MTSEHDDRTQSLRQPQPAAMANLAQGQLTDASVSAADEPLRGFQMHQTELDMQAENLRRAQVAKGESRGRHDDLYDFAPVGYLTLTDEGIVAEANLAAGTLLGVEQTQMFDRRFDRFIAPGEADRWHHHFRDVMRGDEPARFKLLLTRGDGSLFQAILNSRRVANDGQAPVIRVTLTDIGEPVSAGSEQSALEQEVAIYSHGLDFASRRLLAVEEDTKRRLSAELHDRTSPNLAAIKLNLNFLTSQFPEEAAKQSRYLEDLRALIDDTEASVRETCAELRPAALDYAGLPEALGQYARQFARRTGIAVEFECTHAEERLDQSVESLLFRICQEALTNCVKHAHAKSARITLSNEDDLTALTIADDGDGFDMARMQRNGDIKGLGLLNMREMAEFSGGHFSIESSPGKGTRIKVRILGHGLSERRDAQDSLPTSPAGSAAEEYFERFFNLIPDLACIATTDGRFLRINPMWQETLGYSAQEILSTPFRDLIHPEDRDASMKQVERQLAGESVVQFVNRYRCKNGSYRWLEWRATPAVGGKLLFASARDITAAKLAEEALQKSEQALRMSERQMLIAQQISATGSWVYSLETDKIWGSVEGLRIFGFPSVAGDFPIDDIEACIPERERVHQALVGLIREGRKYDLEYAINPADGSPTRVIHSIATIEKDAQGHPHTVLGFVQDITEIRRAEEEIKRMAFYDSLTQLSNRRLLSDRLAQTMAASTRNGLYGALMFLDLDNFKPLNDAYGHEAGDLLLVDVARRIKDCVREADTVARFGGDEFVVMLGELDVDKGVASAEASIVAEKIRAALAIPYFLTIKRENAARETIEHRCTSSIGVTLFVNHNLNADAILKLADKAMYQAKAAGRNQIRFYDAKT